MCIDTPKIEAQSLPESLTWQQISDACKGGRKLLVVKDEVSRMSTACHATTHHPVCSGSESEGFFSKEVHTGH
jgi:hypothetical protein